jgi:putative FmdB family regulatory protein
MPIYEYRCNDCGFQKEYLQKLSDAPLSACPECGKATFNKMLTAAGFHLKGSGWYATDFKGGSKTASESKPSGDAKPAAAAPACGAGACSACST